jgi:hypothetical protein
LNYGAHTKPRPEFSHWEYSCREYSQCDTHHTFSLLTSHETQTSEPQTSCRAFGGFGFVIGHARFYRWRQTCRRSSSPRAAPKAYDARQTLPDTFAGLDAELVFREGEKTATGTICYRSNGKSGIEISGLSEENLKWLRHQAISFISHRTSSEFENAEGQFPASFGQSEVTDFGTLIEYNDPQKLSSRVKNNQSLELQRTAGDKRFYISVLENTEFDAGKFVPTRYAVSYFDPQTRVLQSVIFENSYVKVGDLWLPQSRKVVTIDHVLGKGLRVRAFGFNNIKVIEN